MNPELEALILAYDAFLESRAENRKQAYETLLQQTMDKKPNLSPESFHKAIALAHRRWARKQDSKPPRIPPTA